MNTHRLLAAAACILTGITLFAEHPTMRQELMGSKRPEKKFIYFGWYVPRTLEQWSQPADVIEKDIPFDGVGINMLMSVYRNGKRIDINTSDRSFDRTLVMTKEDFAPWINVLKGKNFKKLTHNFVGAHSCYLSSDWFDDKAWATALNNYRMKVWFAREIGFKGMNLDIELYDATTDAPFSFRGKLGHTYAETEQKVRERGRDFGKMLGETYPNMVLFCYIWASDSKSAYHCDNLASEKHIKLALAPAFWNGIYDTIPETIKIVDGNEDPGYRCAKEADFDKVTANYELYAKYWVAPENQAKYSKITSRGFSIYMDAYVKSQQYPVWKTTDNPVKLLQENISRTQEHAEEYAWMWGEQGTFFTSLYTPELRKEWGLREPQSWDDILPGTTTAIIAGRTPIQTALRHATEKNLVVNGTLDTDTAAKNGEFNVKGWRRWKETNTGGKIIGKDNAVHFDTIDSGCIAQEITGVIPGKRYILTAKSKITAGDQLATGMGYYYNDLNGKGLWRTARKGAFGEPDKDGWRHAYMILDVPTDIQFSTLTVTVSAFGSRYGTAPGNTCVVDDVQLRQVVYPWDAK